MESPPACPLLVLGMAAAGQLNSPIASGATSGQSTARHAILAAASSMPSLNAPWGDRRCEHVFGQVRAGATRKRACNASLGDMTSPDPHAPPDARIGRPLKRMRQGIAILCREARPVTQPSPRLRARLVG